MKRFFKILLVVCGIAVALSLTGLLLFLWEPSAFVWHMRHGFHAEEHGIRFPVPLHYHVSIDSSDVLIIEGHVRSLNKKPARYNTGSVLIFFASPGQEYPLSDAQTLFKPASVDASLMKTGERTATLASRRGECLEYTGPPIQSGDFVFGDKRTEIYCQFGNDVKMRFLGTPPAVQDFYDIIQSATTVGEKR